MGKAKFTIMETTKEGIRKKVQSETNKEYSESIVRDMKQRIPESKFEIVPYMYERDTKPYLEKLRDIRHKLDSSETWTFEKGWSDIKGNFGKLLDASDILLENGNVATLEELPNYTLVSIEEEVESVLNDIKSARERLREAIE